ncbi:cytochrome b [Acetobacter pasteurianus]
MTDLLSMFRFASCLNDMIVKMKFKPRFSFTGYDLPMIIFQWGQHIRATDRWLDALLAHSMEYSLYGQLLLEIFLGYMGEWVDHEFPVYSGIPPFGKFSASTISLLHWLHQWSGRLIIVLTTDHALAACFHYFILSDNVFQRMLVTGNVSNEYGR